MTLQEQQLLFLVALVFIGMFMVMIIIQIISVIYDIKKQTRNEEDQIIKRIKNITRVNITSAIELNDDRKNDIKTKISERLNKDIICDWGVDNEIIAGLIFKIDESIIDNSVRHKLEDLSKEIIKG